MNNMKNNKFILATIYYFCSLFLVLLTLHSQYQTAAWAYQSFLMHTADRPVHTSPP